MGQTTLSRWLKAILLLCGLCGILVYCVVLPILARDFAVDYPEYAQARYPWLIFLWLTALPCYGVLILGWGIAGSIGRDQSFTMNNARRLRRISILAAADTLFFFLGNLVFLLLSWSHACVVLAALLLCFVGIAICVASAALSHLVTKAAALQEQSDLTI